MPIPLIVYAGGAALTALGVGSYAAGKEIGETIGKTVPLVVGATALYLVLKER